MTRDDIIRMAQEAAIMPPNWGATENQWRSLEAFANLVAAAERNRTWTQDHWTEYERSIAAAEREACAKVCDEKVAAEYATGKVDHNEMGWTQACAFTIRERGAP
jgi:hypothetical protein